jgi:hypothetical protein
MLKKTLTVGAAVAGVTVLMATSAFGAAPTANATPNTGLKNNQVVKVSGAHFSPGATLAILECNHAVATAKAAACNTSKIATGTASSTGTLPPTPFKVFTGKVGNGKCGGSVKANHTCYIVVANTSKNSQAAVAKIVFK